MPRCANRHGVSRNHVAQPWSPRRVPHSADRARSRYRPCGLSVAPNDPVPGAAPVFDLDVDRPADAHLGADHETPAGPPARAVRARVRRQLAHQQDRVVSGGGAIQEPGDQGTHPADLVPAAGKGAGTMAHCPGRDSCQWHCCAVTHVRIPHFHADTELVLIRLPVPEYIRKRHITDCRPDVRGTPALYAAQARLCALV